MKPETLELVRKLEVAAEYGHRKFEGKVIVSAKDLRKLIGAVRNFDYDLEQLRKVVKHLNHDEDHK